MATLFITGATGFIGRNLISDLLEQKSDLSIVAAVREKNSSLPEKVKQCVLGDYLKKPDWEKALQGCDYVIHLAAITNGDKKHIQHINVKTTEDLVLSAQKVGVKRFIFLSSIKIFGEISNHPFSENDQLNPQNEYAKSKFEAEKKLIDFTKKSEMEYTIIRPPLVYGARVKGNFNKLVKLATLGLPLPLGGIQNRRTLCAVNNLTDFMITALNHPKAANELFCIADEESLSTSELLQSVAMANNKKLLLLPHTATVIENLLSVFGKKETADSLFGNLEVNSKKAEHLLSWKRPYTTLQAIENTFKATTNLI